MSLTDKEDEYYISQFIESNPVIKSGLEEVAQDLQGRAFQYLNEKGGVVIDPMSLSTLPIVGIDFVSRDDGLFMISGMDTESKITLGMGWIIKSIAHPEIWADMYRYNPETTQEGKAIMEFYLEKLHTIKDAIGNQDTDRVLHVLSPIARRMLALEVYAKAVNDRLNHLDPIWQEEHDVPFIRHLLEGDEDELAKPFGNIS